MFVPVGESSWRSLSEMDLRFARSRRRAEARRKEPPKRSPAGWRSVRAALLALILLTVVAESTRLESSNATSPTRAAATPTLDPACPVPARFRAAFAGAATKTGVPLSLLVATAYEESRMDPAANVLAGARYLRQLLDRFGSVELALAAYNAGPTAVERSGAAPTLGTLRYVKNVEARAGRLLACAG